MERKILHEQNNYRISEGKIKGLLTIERSPLHDERGFFKEVFRNELLQKLSVQFDVVQMNHSLSNTGVVRGIHAEKWDKLIYPLSGEMAAFMVDLRASSETFGVVEQFNFDCTDRPDKALFLPNGIGNSICAITGPVNYVYLVSAYWTPESSFAINPFDPNLNIEWPVRNPILTDKDRTAPTMKDRFPNRYK